MALTTARANIAATMAVTSAIMLVMVADRKASGVVASQVIREEMLAIMFEMIHMAHHNPRSAEFSGLASGMFSTDTVFGSLLRQISWAI